MIATKTNCFGSLTRLNALHWHTVIVEIYFVVLKGRAGGKTNHSDPKVQR